MRKTMYPVKPQHLCADLPGQTEFVKAMEDKIGTLLMGKLSGEFKMIADPDGFHYGFTYGSHSYTNIRSLKDIDRTLVTDSASQQLGFSNQSFSVLYDKVLNNTGYKLSTADQDSLNKKDIEAQSYTDAVIRAFKDEFSDAGLSVYSIPAIFEYIISKYQSIDNIPVYYSATKNAMADYNAHAQESYQMHSMISKAQTRLKNLSGNIENPTLQNGALQTDTAAYYVGYSLPDFSQTVAALNTDNNKIDILLEVSNFNGDSSSLSIDHKAAFIIPTPICVFGTSDTKYTLNTLVTSSSNVSMQMSFKGITTIAPKPSDADANASSGWYDETILSEIVRNTGNDSTGYCLVNGEFDPHSMFGQGGTFNRLKEFVICQAPEIVLTMTEINTSAVKECFQHSSKLDIDFFGFGISSSAHHYETQSVTIDSDARTATITLGAPKPSATASVETSVAYLLGGTVEYPPVAKTAMRKRKLSFSFQVPDMFSSAQTRGFQAQRELTPSPGEHTRSIYLGKVNLPDNSEESLEAVLNIWYYYFPEEEVIWLSDSVVCESNPVTMSLYRKDGQKVKVLSGRSGTYDQIENSLRNLSEELIRSAEQNGLAVVRRRDIPDHMKELYYRQTDGNYRQLKSTYFGTRNIYRGNVFANASGTSGDVFYDPAGTPVYKSWLDLWSFCTMQNPTVCTACQSVNNLCGAHVLMGQNQSAVPAAGSMVDILPLCSKCNHYTKTGAMTAAVNTMSLVMIW